MGTDRSQGQVILSGKMEIFSRCIVVTVDNSIKDEKNHYTHNQYGVFVTSPVQLSGTPWTVAHQAPLSLGFSRQEYWSRLPFPPPGHLSHPGIEPKSPASAN